MAKTKNISIRFDEDDLKICLIHSKQKTKQKLVDWFCRNYAALYRVEEDNPFKEKKQEWVYDTPKNEKLTNDEPLNFFKPQETFKVKKTLAYFVSTMKDLDKDDTNAILELKAEIEDSELLKKERDDLLYSLKNGYY